MTISAVVTLLYTSLGTKYHIKLLAKRASSPFELPKNEKRVCRWAYPLFVSSPRVGETFTRYALSAYAQTFNGSYFANILLATQQHANNNTRQRAIKNKKNPSSSGRLPATSLSLPKKRLPAATNELFATCTIILGIRLPVR